MKIKTNNKYFLYGLLAAIIGSGNATIIKYTTGSFDAVSFNTLRFSLAALATLPFFLRHSHKLTPKNVRYSVSSGAALFVATICYVLAIEQSQATYVTLLTLLNPIMLVILTLRLTKDKVNKKHLAGFSIAAFGALMVAAGPMFLSGNANLSFYPIATILVFVNVVAYPLGIIFARKSSESRKKLPLVSTVFIQTSVIAALSFITATLINKPLDGNTIASIDSTVMIGALYSGIGVGVLDRILAITSYKKIGAAITGGLAYFGIFLSLTIAVIVLNEKLSLVALVGGATILLGVYISEHHLSSKRKHHIFTHKY